MLEQDNIRTALNIWGPEQVRTRLVTGDIPGLWRHEALLWLQEQESAERRDREEIEAKRFQKQMLGARRATLAGWVAAWAGIAAVLFTGVDIALSLMLHH